ncbi:MAG: hypothetical protein QOC93_3423 [Actinomycetota bacterium]|nr:hypothetical protein [Actinomycetota bacterium]
MCVAAWCPTATTDAARSVTLTPVLRPGDDIPIRLNASLAQIAGLGAFVLVATGMFTIWLGPFWGALVHALGVLTLVREGSGVEVSPAGVRFWGFLRPRSLTWAQVRDIEAPGSRIHLCTRTAVHVLGAPRRGHLLADPAFAGKYALLRQTWERQRAGGTASTEIGTGVR